MSHLLVLHVMGKWWKITIDETVIQHTKPLSTGPDIPVFLMRICNVVYNVTTETMIKNRASTNTKLDSAIVMRIWMESDSLPTLEFKNDKALQLAFVQWCKSQE